MTALLPEKKGKLELLLDEFTDVHGAVLLGMHKDLQTLKQEVDSRVETRIGMVLEQVKTADSSLHTHVDDAEQIIIMLDGINRLVESQRSDFQREVAQAQKTLLLTQQEHQTKILAALKVAEKLNSNSKSSLQAVSEQSEALHQREIAFQKRTRQVEITVSLVVFATLGVWIWLTLSH